MHACPPARHEPHHHTCPPPHRYPSPPCVPPFTVHAPFTMHTLLLPCTPSFCYAQPTLPCMHLPPPPQRTEGMIHACADIISSTTTIADVKNCQNYENSNKAFWIWNQSDYSMRQREKIDEQNLFTWWTWEIYVRIYQVSACWSHTQDLHVNDTQNEKQVGELDGIQQVRL